MSILDMLNGVNSKEVCDLFKKASHHRNISHSDYSESFSPGASL